MKCVWIAAALTLTAPGAFAGVAGNVVPQVFENSAKPLGPVIVQFQESTIIRMKDKIAGISLGSSHIANVNVHDSHTIVITGRAYGTTSLHILDGLGNIIADTQVHVVDASASRLTVTRAGQTYSMDCTPNCQPAPNIGDEADYFQAITGQAAVLQSQSR